ncbi:alpha/beta hydrolase [Rhodobacterales bacterium]|nr:alpha/beta hydrolase [Rhodobacterales bacterium]
MLLIRLLMLLFFVVAVVLVLGGVYSAWRIHGISARNVPDGDFAVVDGVRLHYHHVPASKETGAKAPVLVFLHGASGNAYDTMLAFKEAFAGQYALLFIDRPGFGFSERGGDRGNSLEGQAALVAGLLKHLKTGPVVVVGHSYGAAVTAALGLAEPDLIAGMAFIAPVSHPWPGGVAWYHHVAAMPVIGDIFTRTITLPVAEQLAPNAILNVFAPEAAPDGYGDKIHLPLLYRPENFQANSADLAGLKENVTRLSPRYPELDRPALVITGTEDTVVWPSIHSEGLLRDLPAAELLVLDGAGHMPHHTRTQDVVAGIERLVDRVVRKDETAAAQ